MALLSSAGCAAGPGAGGESTGPVVAPAPPASTPAVPGPAAEAGPRRTGPAAAADASAEANLAAALRRAFEGGEPGAGGVRGALAAAGFAAEDVQVTAGRTPTGLEADAVEVGVKRGGDCLVAQVRSGAVSVTVLPVLADGRCLVGAAAS